MKDIHNQIRPRLMLGPTELAADNTPANFSLIGMQAACLLIAVGVGGITFTDSNKIEFKLRHGDTTTVGDHTAVTDDDVEIIMPDGTKGSVGSGGIVRSLIAAHAAATITKVGYIGNKANLSLLADFTGTHGSGSPASILKTPITAVLIDGKPNIGYAFAGQAA